MMSCSKSNTVAPGEGGAPGDVAVPEDSVFRSLFWNGDIGLSADNTDDLGVDVTNVVFDRGYVDKNGSQYEEDWTNGQVGYVVDIDNYWYSAYPEYPHAVEVNVVAWAQKNVEMVYVNDPPELTAHEYYEVYFKVYGIDDEEDPIDSQEWIIQTEYFEYVWGPDPGDKTTMHVSHGRPKVTAWLDSGDGTSGSGLEAPYLCVAIAYQWRKAYEEVVDEREVHVVVYKQYDLDDYDEWDIVVYDAKVAPNDYELAEHPDIVYGAYWGKYENGDPNPDFEAILVTYEEIDTSNWQRTIYLAELYENDNDFGTSWLVDNNHIDTIPDPDFAVPFYPRIDIGLDSSDDYGDDYYIAVVAFNFVTPVLVNQVYHYVVNLYTAWKSYNTPGFDFNDYVGIDVQEYFYPKNALPYVEIDPLENYLVYERMNYTHVVWSRLEDEDGETIVPYYTNSFEQHSGSATYPYIFPIDYVYEQRQGLPTITTYTNQDPYDHVGTIQYISEDGNDHYPVYSCVFYYDNGDEDETAFDTSEQISSGYSDDDLPWTFGPTSALRGDDGHILCAWTEYDENNPPDIYGDLDYPF